MESKSIKPRVTYTSTKTVTKVVDGKVVKEIRAVKREDDKWFVKNESGEWQPSTKELALASGFTPLETNKVEEKRCAYMLRMGLYRSNRCFNPATNGDYCEFCSMKRKAYKELKSEEKTEECKSEEKTEEANSEEKTEETNFEEKTEESKSEDKMEESDSDESEDSDNDTENEDDDTGEDSDEEAEEESLCFCPSCKFQRGEITKEQALKALKEIKQLTRLLPLLSPRRSTPSLMVPLVCSPPVLVSRPLPSMLLTLALLGALLDK